MPADFTFSWVSHIRPESDGHLNGRPLEEHLRGVADRAGRFASPFGARDWAYLAGLWHDLGKYSGAFQRYLRSRLDPDAHIENAPGRVDHSSAGALYAVERLSTPAGRVLAYLIAGHHAGLSDYESSDTGAAALKVRLARGRDTGLLAAALEAPIPADILGAEPPSTRLLGGQDGLHLWLRLLFSCLVDADFLDTEGFLNPIQGAQRQGFPTIEALRAALDRHMQTLMRGADDTAVNRIRVDIYRRCCERSADTPGLFSLTVPTGGGKTLASLAFALRHAERHGKRRVIYAIPYTSIIEQTADVFRHALDDAGGEVLVEHHSNAETDPARESHRTRLACENWDAPLIVTTNVQLFESLFAARTSRCRKLHNLVDSVIILDEAQTLPPELLQPIVSVIDLLGRYYGVSFVFCTATQPALGSRSGLGALFRGLDDIREIMPDVAGLYRELQRVRVRLPPDLHHPVTWEGLADELIGLDRSALCIVDRRADCRTLYGLVKRGGGRVRHLSALMCGQHRSEVIADIKRELSAGHILKVVSTQLVEAGVDLDFPLVYRALAGLDAIAQAAGRCNREGRLPQPGEVRVFVPPREPPPGLLRLAAAKTRQLLPATGADLFAPDNFRHFFDLLYSDTETDRYGIQALLTRDAGSLSVAFRSAADAFRMVRDEQSETLFVKYGEGAKYLRMLAADGPERWLMRRLQRFAVSLPRWDIQRLVRDGQVGELFPGMFVQIDDTLYDGETGVVLDAAAPSPTLVV